MRVLVVDDDPSVRGAVRVGLDPIEVVEADDGPSALRILRTEYLDVVLLDISMPLMDGLTTLRTMKREKEYGNPAVLMLSGRGSEADHVAAFRLGAHGYLTKPFDPDDLEKAVREMAERTPQQREEARQEELRRAEFLDTLERRFGY